MRLAIDLPARLLPYLRLREVAVLACSCSRLEGIAAGSLRESNLPCLSVLEFFNRVPPPGLDPCEDFTREYPSCDTESLSESSENEDIQQSWPRRPARRCSWA